jgi:hypothetical protein
MILDLPLLLDILKEEDLNLIQDIKILVKGGIPVNSETQLSFKNKLFSFQEPLSTFRSRLSYLIQMKKIDLQKYEGENGDIFNDGKRKSKEDKKSEMLSSDNVFYDKTMILVKLESLLKYVDDVYFILMAMVKNI